MKLFVLSIFILLNLLAPVNTSRAEKFTIDFTPIEPLPELVEEPVDATVMEDIEDAPQNETRAIFIASNEYFGWDEQEFIAEANALGLTPVYAESKNSYNDRLTEGLVVWHGSGDYVEGENFRYGLSLGKRPTLTHNIDGVYVDYRDPYDYRKSLVDSGYTIFETGEIYGQIGIFAHNYISGNQWKKDFRVNDVLTLNGGDYTFVIDEIGEGYQDSETQQIMYGDVNILLPDTMPDVVLVTCNEGQSRWIALGHRV